MKFGSTLTMVIAAASIGLSGPALAQDQSQEETQDQAQSQATDQATDAAVPEVPEIAAEDVTQGQIASFVNAMIALERIRAEYLPQIQAAETDDERQALAAEADEAAKAAVTKTKGITPGEYLAIGRAAQGNQELGEKINTRIVELREKQQQKRKPLQQPNSSEDGSSEGETVTQ
ncbi:DUF4168 domain-containing protein [Roseovarius sp.]|jgi:soluble lytic murein transglycosylase-like protein|uniref:DUF4168 domain-containing protein n=1 Tax=Roseovarius sp. TaxID=1486281 RepID=UPI00262B2DF2|nr:DUF4168 domain-containing protein [Roseovarius sp.]MDM8168693.1 DUF4168 domain-containing protein [Roseovarius sp.]